MRLAIDSYLAHRLCLDGLLDSQLSDSQAIRTLTGGTKESEGTSLIFGRLGDVVQFLNCIFPELVTVSASEHDENEDPYAWAHSQAVETISTPESVKIELEPTLVTHLSPSLHPCGTS